MITRSPAFKRHLEMVVGIRIDSPVERPSRREHPRPCPAGVGAGINQLIQRADREDPRVRLPEAAHGADFVGPGGTSAAMFTVNCAGDRLGDLLQVGRRRHLGDADNAGMAEDELAGVIRSSRRWSLRRPSPVCRPGERSR